MDWTYDATDNAYTLLRGDARCRVWYTSLENWAAACMHRGTSSAAYNFTTVEDAKAWCGARVMQAERRR